VEWKNDTYLEAMEGGFEWNFDDKIAVDTTERSSECSSEALFQLFWVSSWQRDCICLVGAEKHKPTILKAPTFDTWAAWYIILGMTKWLCLFHTPHVGWGTYQEVEISASS
jgi:hypothetical protein